MDFGGDDFHGSDGTIPVRRYKREELLPSARAFWDACVAAGYPETPAQNHPKSMGVGLCPLNNVDSTRMSTALTNLASFRHPLNLTVRSDVLAHRVVLDGNRAVGIEAESGGGDFRIDSAEVILCGGTINSPQPLMLSGVGPAGT